MNLIFIYLKQNKAPPKKTLTVILNTNIQIWIFETKINESACKPGSRYCHEYCLINHLRKNFTLIKSNCFQIAFCLINWVPISYRNKSWTNLIFFCVQVTWRKSYISAILIRVGCLIYLKLCLSSYEELKSSLHEIASASVA